MASSPEEWIVAARLLRPQGRRGELLAEPHVDLTVFSVGRKLWLGKAGGVPEHSAEQEVEQVWQPTGRNAGRIVLKLAGVDTISAAERLAGQDLLLPVQDLPALDENTFRVRDLVGCALFDGDRLAGTVADVQFPVAADGRTRLNDAPDLLAVLPAQAGGDAEVVLVPFVSAWLAEVDIGAKRIVMQLPPGIFDTLEES